MAYSYQGTMPGHQGVLGRELGVVTSCSFGNASFPFNVFDPYFVTLAHLDDDDDDVNMLTIEKNSNDTSLDIRNIYHLVRSTSPFPFIWVLEPPVPSRKTCRMDQLVDI